MKFKFFRFLFQVGAFILVLVAVSPVFNSINVSLGSNERHSQFILLDSNGRVGDYPLNVQTRKDYTFFVKIVNNLEQSTYYRIFVKLRNQSSIVNEGGTVNEINFLYESRVLVDDGDFLEIPFQFKILNISSSDNFLIIEKVFLNGKPSNIDCSSDWDSKKDGFYFQLFFELWRYDVLVGDFIYDDKTVGFWFNVNPS